MVARVTKTKTVTRADLAAVVHKHSKGSREEAAHILDAVLAEISNALAAGQPVLLNGFCAFNLISKDQRRGRNPMWKRKTDPLS